MMDLDHAYKSLRPSQLCNELALRFEVASIVYADDDSQKLFDRLEEQEIWAFRGYDHSKERYTGDYDVEGFGSVHARNLSSIRAPRSFRALFARPTAIGADMAKEAESSIQSAVARMNTLLDNLSPLEFEQFVAEVLYKRGFKCLLTPATGDNGVDVFAVLYHADDSDPGDVTIVQCKRTENIVGVDLVRELAGAKLLHNSEKALLVTTSHFSRGAHKLVKDPMYFGIELADLYALREWWLKAQGYTTSPTPLTGPTSACIARRSVPLRAPRD